MQMPPGLIALMPIYAILVVVIGWTVALTYCAKDARRRGVNPLLVCAFVLFFGPLGFIAWLVCRPAPPASASPKPFRLEDYRAQ